MADGLMRRLLEVRPSVAAAGVGGVHLFLALMVFVPTPHTGGDNAAYVALAESLVDTGRYVSVYDPERPPQTQYPPVFPALLALGLLAGLKPWVGLKLVVLLCSTAAAALTYLWVRTRAPPAMALVVSLLVALSPGVLEYSHWILSDAPFWGFTMLALWALAGLREGDRVRLVTAAVAITLAYFTRTAGLALVLATLGWLAWRRRWKDLGIVAAIVLPLAGLWWLRAMALGGVEYMDQFMAVNPYRPAEGHLGVGDLVGRIAGNNGRYLAVHLPMIIMGSRGLFPTVVAWALAALSVLGWVGRLKRPEAAELFLPLYLGLLFIWPEVWSSERFLLPVYPIILALAGEALVKLGAKAGPQWGGVLGGAAAAGLVILMLPALSLANARGRDCSRLHLQGEPYACVSPAAADLFELAEWARNGLPEGAVVISRKPRMFYVLSGKPGRVYPMHRTPEQLLELADRIGSRYVVVDHVDALSSYYVIPALVRKPDAFCAVLFSGPGRAAVFGIVSGAAQNVDPGARLEFDPALDVSFPICPPSYYPGDTR